MSTRATARPVQAPLSDYVDLAEARDFVRTLSWSGDDHLLAPIVAIKLQPLAKVGPAGGYEALPVACDAGLVVGYMRGRSPAELDQQRSVLESAGCDRVYRDLQTGGASAWAGLLRALAILRDGDTLMAGPRTLTTMLNELGGLNDAR